MIREDCRKYANAWNERANKIENVIIRDTENRAREQTNCLKNINKLGETLTPRLAAVEKQLALVDGETQKSEYIEENRKDFEKIKTEISDLKIKYEYTADSKELESIKELQKNKQSRAILGFENEL